MTVAPIDGKRNKRRPSLKGAVMLDVVHGKQRSRAWPAKRGKKLHPVVAEQMEWFRQAQWATKYMAGEMLMQATEATKDTPLLPRDILTMMLAGRLLAFTMPSGRTYWSVQVGNDVSTALDALADIPGSLLVRGPDGWIGIGPSIDRYVLMFDGETGMPIWHENEGGGGGGGALDGPYTGRPDFSVRSGTDFGQGNFGARCITAPQRMQVTHVVGFATATRASCLVRPALYDAPIAGPMGALLAQGPQVTGLVPGMIEWPLDAPYVMERGEAVWAGVQCLTQNGQFATVNGLDTGFFGATGALPSTAGSASYGGGASMCFWLKGELIS